MNISARWILLSWILWIGGCAAAPANNSTEKLTGEKTATPAALAQESQKANNDLERLASIWNQRKQENLSSDYPLGPGDLIEFNVPGMEEIKNMSERVNGDGTISLPFAGVIKVNGMTEKGLRDEIRRRLEENYMRNPQINLVVKEFRSRQVAVMGAVHKPGLYNLASYSDTLLTALSQAGGMRPEAAERILFVPAEPVDPDQAKKVVDILPANVIRQDPSPVILKNVDPITISLDSIGRVNQERYLQLPARAGDIIMLPGAGEVLVQGWVEKPGSFKITPGLTILGAVAAAGGPMFPADTGAVELIRTDRQGQKTAVVADLDAIKKGTRPDLQIREGDVIDVTSSGPRLAAYGLYRFFTSVMSVGASIPIR